MDAQTLEDARELLDQLLAIQHNNPVVAVIIRELEELIGECNH